MVEEFVMMIEIVMLEAVADRCVSVEVDMEGGRKRRKEGKKVREIDVVR